MGKGWRVYLGLLIASILAIPLSTAASRAAKPKVVATHASELSVGLPSETVPKSEGDAYLQTLPENLRKELMEKGSVLIPETNETDDGGMAGYIKAVVIFEQNKPRAYELMVQPSNQVLFLPRLTKAQEIWHRNEGELTEFTLSAGPADVTFRTQHWFWPNFSRMEWALDPNHKNDIKVAEGFWQLYALNDKQCVGEYGTLVDTGLPVPTMLQSYFARKDVPEALDAFQKYINSNGKFRRE